MSLYPQQQAFGQSFYPSPAFPPQPSYGFGATTSFYPVDPDSFRRDYTAHLAELTINSRPIIQGLSVYAQECSRWGDVVVQCIETHIRRVPPWMKLPAFYLVDAISKNVYEPYARHFATIVATLFLDAYGQVDHATRSKMEEMFLTWRTGSPNGLELFDIDPQVAIERGIWGSDVTSETSTQTGFISKSQVLSELEFALGQKERNLRANAYDSTSQSHVSILQKLHEYVQAGVSQQELSQISTQIHTHVWPPRSNTTPTQLPQQSKYTTPNTSFPPTPVYSTSASTPQPIPQLPYPQPQVPSYPASNRPHIPAVQITDASASAAPTSSVPDVLNLFQSLVKSGLLSSHPTAATSSTKVEKSEPPKLVDHVKEEARSYCEAVMSEPVKFTSADITRRFFFPSVHRSNIVFLMYDRLPSQCGQCGIRLSETDLGKQKMQDLLDTHFRQNRKAKQSVGHGHSRSWFILVHDWIYNASTISKAEGLADLSCSVYGKPTSVAEEAKRVAELRSQFVVVPAGDEGKSIVCPICKDTLKAEFNEDDEDWVWKNAMEVNSRISHATCHAEALSSASSLASRLRPDVAQGRSQSRTMESAAICTTPPKVGSPTQASGLKRKAEVDSSTGAHVDSPPLKRTMLAVSA
ncbi:hypothetical protein OF83DRAFT_1070320 [Amylostereum chailletii]|nr:hypothetical protein OF83DRAFT_1070320 [Amylostereum chailletii]